MVIRNTTVDNDSTATDNSHCYLTIFSRTTPSVSDKVALTYRAYVTDNKALNNNHSTMQIIY